MEGEGFELSWGDIVHLGELLLESGREEVGRSEEGVRNWVVLVVIGVALSIGTF